MSGKRRIDVALQTYREFVDSAASKLTAIITGKRLPINQSPQHQRLTHTAFNATNLANGGSSFRNMMHRFHIYQQPLPHIVNDTTRRALWFTEADDPADWTVLNDSNWNGTTTASIRFEPCDSDTDGWEIGQSNQSDHSTSKPYKLIFEGVLAPVPPFEMRSAPWSQDSVVPFAQALKPGQSISPSGETTPLGMLNGFCAFISPQYRYPDLNLDKYNYLTLRMKTDGRPYMFNVRCRERLPLLHQARVPAETTPRPMHEKEIRFEHFTTTLDGKMKFMQVPVPRDRISSFGFSLSGPPGPFRLELESIVAKKGVTKWEKSQLPPDEVRRLEQDARIEQQGRSLWWTQAAREKQREIESKQREIDKEQHAKEQQKQQKQ